MAVGEGSAFVCWPHTSPHLRCQETPPPPLSQFLDPDSLEEPPGGGQHGAESSLETEPGGASLELSGWGLVLAGATAVLLGGGVLFLLLRVSEWPGTTLSLFAPPLPQLGLGSGQQRSSHRTECQRLAGAAWDRQGFSACGLGLHSGSVGHGSLCGNFHRLLLGPLGWFLWGQELGQLAGAILGALPLGCSLGLARMEGGRCTAGEPL